MMQVCLVPYTDITGSGFFLEVLVYKVSKLHQEYLNLWLDITTTNFAVFVLSRMDAKEILMDLGKVLGFFYTETKLSLYVVTLWEQEKRKQQFLHSCSRAHYSHDGNN